MTGRELFVFGLVVNGLSDVGLSGLMTPRNSDAAHVIFSLRKKRSHYRETVTGRIGVREGDYTDLKYHMDKINKVTG